MEKKHTIGRMAITPMSPTCSLIMCSTHHSKIVTTHTKDTQYCLRVNDSLMGLMALISRSPSPSGIRPGWYDQRRSNQMSTIEMAETGSATMNHVDQSMGGSIAPIAMRFWGDEMGELWPPMFAARAIAS